jgi:hypothetical protein
VRTYADISQAQALLDWAPETPIDEGLQHGLLRGLAGVGGVRWAWSVESAEECSGREKEVGA